MGLEEKTSSMVGLVWGNLLQKMECPKATFPAAETLRERKERHHFKKA
jgi:hypothetical protein